MVTTQPELEEMAKQWVKVEFNKPGAVFLHPIHRLDRPALGVVVFARTSKALSRLNIAMRERLIKKHYRCVVDPSPAKKEAFLEHYLVHGDHKAFIHSSGKKATLFYKAQDNVVSVELFTGRYHQIRAQLAAIGSPIAGDAKYGSTAYWREGIALIHTDITFPHPITGASMTISSRQTLLH